MPNLHIYGEKDRALLTDEHEVITVLKNLSSKNDDYLRSEGDIKSGLVVALGYSNTHKKLVCLLRATRISNGNWWLTWDTDRVKLNKSTLKSEIKP